MRLIDAHALIDEINEMWKIHPAGLENRKILSFEAVIDLIGAAPTISLSDKRNYEAETKELVKIFLENLNSTG